MRSSYYGMTEREEWYQNTYQYPDIVDMIEQEEKLKERKRSGGKGRKKAMRLAENDKADIRTRLAVGAFVSKAEQRQYLESCTAYELEELRRFYALHGIFGMASIASFLGIGDNGHGCGMDRGTNRGYTEGYTSTVIEVDGKNTVVMMPTATPDVNIEEDSTTRMHNVLDVMENNLHENFDDAMRWLTANYPEDVFRALDLSDAIETDFVRIHSKRIESSWDQPLDKFKVDVLLRTEFKVKIPVKKKCGSNYLLVYEDAKRYVDYRLRYVLNLLGQNGVQTCSGPFGGPASLFPEEMIAELQDWKSNDILRPNLEKYEDYVRLADKMLAEVYPEALESPTEIDGDLLVERLSEYMEKRCPGFKLRLREVELGKNCGIKGKIFYADTTIPGKNGKSIHIKAGDIIINLDEIDDSRPSDRLATIIHECIHVYVDTPCFLLQKMAGQPTYGYTDRNIKWLRAEGNKSDKDYQRLERMEKDTEKLTAFVMLEEHTFRAECARLLAMCGGVADMRSLKWMLEQLTPEYGASMQMTKIRMKEVGYNKAEGLWNFTAEGQRIPDHDVSGEWESGVCYTIDRDVALALLERSERFVKAIASGKYVYVNGVYVLNRPKYVTKNTYGDTVLTADALGHMNECCLSFKPGHRHIDMEFSCGAAARGKKKPVEGKFCEVEFESEPGTDGYYDENEAYANAAEDWGELAGKLHGTFREALQTVLDELGLTQQTLANRLGVSRQALDKWLKREAILKRHVVGICIALSLDCAVSFRLIELAPHRIGFYGTDAIFMHMLCDKEMTIVRGNDIMEQRGLKKLNDGRQFEQDLLDFDEDTRGRLRRKYGTELTRKD